MSEKIQRYGIFQNETRGAPYESDSGDYCLYADVEQRLREQAERIDADMIQYHRQCQAIEDMNSICIKQEQNLREHVEAIDHLTKYQAWSHGEIERLKYSDFKTCIWCGKHQNRLTEAK